MGKSNILHIPSKLRACYMYIYKNYLTYTIAMNFHTKIMGLKLVVFSIYNVLSYKFAKI